MTVYYAHGAKTAADAANKAASSTRARIYAVDWVLHFSTMIAEIDSILSEFNGKPDVNRVCRSCTELRGLAAMASKINGEAVTDETKKKFIRSPTQFASISSQLAGSIGEDKSREIFVRIRKVLSDQRELCAIALMQAKQHAAGVADAN